MADAARGAARSWSISEIEMERMATAAIETTPRIMPKRWFYGETMHWMISGVTADYSGSIRVLETGERTLGAFILPTFQRPLVWTVAQKVRLIESLYMGLPIGALVYNQTMTQGPCDRWLLDGQQRVSAIVEFVTGALSVNGWRYPDLPTIEQRHFQRLGVAIIETRINDQDQCRDIYDRLAYGGTAHKAKMTTTGNRQSSSETSSV